MSSLFLVLVLLRLAASVAVTYFVFFLYQKVFRAGVMEAGFRMLAISMLFLTASRLLDVVTAIQPTNGVAILLTPVIGTAFGLIALYGFYLLYRVWRVDKKEPRTEKPLVN
jgi:hypothetical protein